MSEVDEDKLFEEFAAKRAPDSAATPAVETTTETPADATATASAETVTPSTETKTPTPETKVADAATPAPAATGTKEAPSTSTPAPDHWANATPEQRAEYEAAKAWENKYKSEQGKVPYLQRELTRVTSEIAELKAKSSAPAKGTPPSDDKAPKSLKESDRFKQLAEDYPDLVGPLLEEMESLKQHTKETKGSVDALAAERMQRDLVANETYLTSQIPNWQGLIQSQDEFKAWISTKSRAFQQMAAVNAEAIVDAQAAVDVLGAYQAHLHAKAADVSTASSAPTNLAARREAQLKGAKAPATNRSPSPTVSASGTGDEQDALFNEFAAKKEKRA